MGKTLASALLLGLMTLNSALGHSYHLGECPLIPPMDDFDMTKFLGKWYVIEKTSTTSWCYTYNFTLGHQPTDYIIHKAGENSPLGIKHASLNNRFDYEGTLRVPFKDTPARMNVNFPMNPLGSYPFVVFTTDYVTYAGVYSCQKMPLSNRRSASILSRTNTLSKDLIEKVQVQLEKYGINSRDLSTIEHANCVKPETTPKPVDVK